MQPNPKFGLNPEFRGRLKIEIHPTEYDDLPDQIRVNYNATILFVAISLNLISDPPCYGGTYGNRIDHRNISRQ